VFVHKLDGVSNCAWPYAADFACILCWGGRLDGFVLFRLLIQIAPQITRRMRQNTLMPSPTHPQKTPMQTPTQSPLQPPAPNGPSVQPKNPLHGVTLETIVTALAQYYGWQELAQRIPVRCFALDPSVASSLRFLRKTPWAREKVEGLYLFMLREQRRRS
jgi:hypothetical protein